MQFTFPTYKDFLKEYKKYHTHQCSKCGSLCELSNEHVDVVIDDRKMHFKDLLLLICTTCGSGCLPHHTKQMIDGCYKIMVDEGHYEGEQYYRGYRKKFEYCKEQDFIYDHRDYYNIPGLCIDQEHSVEGFLTPVYFSKKVLLYFLQDPDYNVKLGAETYGYFSFKDEWGIPFGINRNGKVVFWLGDLDYLDEQTLNIMKPHNIESDHQLIVSEFYAGQMCCIWSDPNREIQICEQKNVLFSALLSQYNISLFHLEDEIGQQKTAYVKPIVFTEKTIEPTINMLHKVLIEGVSITGFRKLYLKIAAHPNEKYLEWKSIKFYEALLGQIIAKDNDVREIIAPLYLLNDFRQYYDHLLPLAKKNEIKENIINSLKVASFNDIEELYITLLNRLGSLFEYLVLGYTP
jgi:hypothetical protein